MDREGWAYAVRMLRQNPSGVVNLIRFPFILAAAIVLAHKDANAKS